MIKKFLFGIFIILSAWVCFLAYENNANKKYYRQAHDAALMRQIILAMHEYNNKYKSWPDKLEYLDELNAISDKSFISRQGVRLGVSRPHYIYFRPKEAEPKSSEIILALKLECMEVQKSKIMVGYADGSVLPERPDIIVNFKISDER